MAMAILLGLGCTTTAKTIEYFLEANYFRVNPDCSGPVWVQGINGMLPGPEIRVKRYDRLQVTLVNRLPTEKLAIHWHGFRQQGSQEYDGALSITMCGVEPGTSFTYDFIVDEPPGSYHYGHAAPGHVAARGLFGPLIVEDDIEPNRTYDSYDRDVTISLFDWWPESMKQLDMKRQAYLSRPDTQSPQGNNVGLREFHNILINGKGVFNAFGPDFGTSNCTDVEDLFQVVGTSGEILRLRVMNLGAVYALRFRIDGHRIQIIQADGVDIVPYITDAVTMGTGERFDVLVSMDQNPGSYWIRAETLEGNGVRHGQLAVLRYEGTLENVEPSLGFARIHNIGDTSLMTLNCVDQEPISWRCRPLTDLRRPSNSTLNESELGASHSFRQIEVNVRSFRGNSPGEFTRVVDGGNPFEDQFQGSYAQFHRPNVPYSYIEGQSGEHPNTLSVKLSLGETVRILLQWQDRVAHSWHLHGHKFVVLGVFAPNYGTDCDLLYCRSEAARWLNRDGLPQDLLDPEVAPVKDTVFVPAGGWAVIQFKATNPGWWLLGSQMHLHEGMGLILIEGEDAMPERLKNDTYFADRGFPSCDDELGHVERNGKGFTCQCWQDPDMKINNMPLNSYTCSNPYLCESLTELDGASSQIGNRARDYGRTARVGLAIVEIILAMLLPVLKEFMHRRAREGADAWKEATSEIRLGEVGEQLGQFSLDLDQIDQKRTAGSKNEMLRSYSTAMANLAEEQTALVQYSVPISFEATVVNRACTLHLHGELPGGSVCFVIGRWGRLGKMD